MSKQTPTLAQVILDAMEARLAGLHTMLPGTVVAVDVTKGKCDVRPEIRRQGVDGDPITLPVIPNCPINFYRAGKAGVFIPVSVGDKVEIRFCERSIDLWLEKGGTVDPQDARKHQLTDAVVYPGMYPFSEPPVGADAANLVVINDKAKSTFFADGKVKTENASGSITMTAGGKFLIQGVSDELLQVLSELIEKLKTVKTPTMLGPQTFLSTDIVDLTALKTRLDGLKG